MTPRSSGAVHSRWPPSRWLSSRPASASCSIAFRRVASSCLQSSASLSPNIWQFYITFFVLGLVANGIAQFAYTRTILTWFPTHRGFTLALLLTGSGVGSIVIPPLTQWMIQSRGWRTAYLMLGGIALLGLPLTALLRNRSQAPTVHVELAAQGVSVATALRTAGVSVRTSGRRVSGLFPGTARLPLGDWHVLRGQHKHDKHLNTRSHFLKGDRFNVELVLRGECVPLLLLGGIIVP